MRERLRRGCPGILTAAILALCSGCAGNAPVPVSGKVTVEGVPVEGAGVFFTPKDGNGRPASGETQADGTYRLTTLKVGDGALRGDYVVTIVWSEPQHPYLALRDTSPQKEALHKEYLEWKAKHKEKPSPVAPIYAEPAKSPLTQSVPAPGGVANFDLKARP